MIARDHQNTPMTVAITGAGAGLGKAIFDRLMFDKMDYGRNVTIHAIDHKFGHDVRTPTGIGSGSVPFPAIDKLDVLINCAGVNRIAWFPEVSDELWDETMDTNARGIWKSTEFYLEALSAYAHTCGCSGTGMIDGNQCRVCHGTPPLNVKGRGGTVINIVSNASHMPMRCSLAYNASKGAAHIMTLQMARELYGTHGITVIGISPNKLKGTEMSADIDRQVMETRGWTATKAQEYQLAGLATGEETDPDVLADFISFLITSKERHKFLHGCIIPYGA